MPILYQVDAFSDTVFSGNPAAVCLLEEECQADWMQAVAAEMNLSETAFVRRVEQGFELRWFTPTVEVNLCGHATLASAHVLWQQGWLNKDEVAHFHTHSGELMARYLPSGDIELDFPTDPTAPLSTVKPLEAILGSPPIALYHGREDWLLELPSEDAVRNAHPDLTAIAALPTRGLIITARSQAPFDFVSRFFAPAAGVNEDPVTGSAHCTLADYWSKRLNKQTMSGWQASARGGRVNVRLDNNRVYLAGQVITVFRGELCR